MSDRQIGELAKQLIAAKKKIANPNDWYPEHEGRQLGESLDGKRLCALRALWRTSGTHQAYDVLFAEARRMGAKTVPEINARGHNEVMKLYDRAISRVISLGL